MEQSLGLEKREVASDSSTAVSTHARSIVDDDKVATVSGITLENDKVTEKEPQNSHNTTASTPANATQYPQGFGLYVIVLALMLSIFLASLDMTIVATAIPKITDEFGGLDKVSWYGSAFFMTNGGFQSSWGKAYKYFPLKITFLLAIAVFEVGSLICALAPNSTVLIVGRAFNGLGAAGLGTGAYTIIAFVAEPKKRPAFTGFVGISYGIASVVGPLLGGVFAGKVSWRWCFYVNLPLGGASAVVILLFFRTPDGAEPVKASWKEKLLQMDPLGVIMVMGFLVTFIMALEFGGQSERWNSSTVIGLLVGCAAILTAFIFWEAFQGDRAMLAPRLLKHRPIGVSSIYTYFFSGSYYLVIYYLPIYFQSIHNTSPIMSGVYNLPLIIAITLSMILSGIFISSTGIATPINIVGTAIAIIGAGLLYTFDLDTSAGKWIGFQIVGGIGWGLAFQIPIIVSQSSAAAEDISSVTAIILFFMNMGGTSFITAAQSVFVNSLISRLPFTAPNVDPAAVIATGATQLRSVFPANQIPGILLAYTSGIKNALVISLCATGVSLVVGFFGRWKRLKSEGSSPVAGAA